MRVKSDVFKYFTKQSSLVQSKGKIDTYACNFCLQKYALHATRMLKHLLKCQRCPENVKTKLKLKKRLALPSPVTDFTLTIPASDNVGKDVLTDDDGPSKIDSANENMSGISSASSKSHGLKAFVDSISPEETTKIWKLLSKAIYATATPLSITENVYWTEAFKHIRPSLPLPSRYILSNSLLEETFEEVESEVKMEIADARFLGVQADGWSNLRRESIINFVVTTPKPVFYRTLTTKTSRHTGEFMATQLSQVYEDIGIDRVVGCVTDNATNMVRAWEILKEKYANNMIAYYGCAAHILNLLCGNLLNLKSVASIVNAAKSIVKTIKNKLILNAAFVQLHAEMLPAKRRQSLKLPVVTRWASVILCLESLQKNKKVLQTLAINDVGQTELDANDRRHILDTDKFWANVEKLISLLQPIKKWIIKLQSDTPNISQVVEAFCEIRQQFEQEIPNSPLLKSEEVKVLDALTKREKMCLTPVHYAANILDPSFRGKNLNDAQCNEGLQYIHDFAVYLKNVEVDAVFKELAEYRSESGFFSYKFVKDSMNNKNMLHLDFWKGICTNLSLRHVAEALLGLPATSASTERSFSAQGIVHNKKRNRLTTSRAGKLTYIHHNLNLLNVRKCINSARSGRSQDPHTCACIGAASSSSSAHTLQAPVVIGDDYVFDPSSLEHNSEQMQTELGSETGTETETESETEEDEDLERNFEVTDSDTD